VNEPRDPNAPLRGPTFAVVAPALGVVVVLIVLALRSCAPSGSQEAEVPELGRLVSPAALELAARERTAGSVIP